MGFILRGLGFCNLGLGFCNLGLGFCNLGGVGSVLTSTLTCGTDFPPVLVGVGVVGAGLCPFLLLGVDFLTGKMREIALFFSFSA